SEPPWCRQACEALEAGSPVPRTSWGRRVPEPSSSAATTPRLASDSYGAPDRAAERIAAGDHARPDGDTAGIQRADALARNARLPRRNPTSSVRCPRETRPAAAPAGDDHLRRRLPRRAVERGAGTQTLAPPRNCIRDHRPRVRARLELPYLAGTQQARGQRRDDRLAQPSPS